MNLIEEAEHKLIGSFIQDRTAFLDHQDRMRAKDFSDPIFRAAFTEIGEIYKGSDEAIELSDLCGRVQEKCGGGFGVMSKLFMAVEEAVTTASIPWAMRQVTTEAKRRHLIERMTALVDDVRKSDDVGPVYAELYHLATEGFEEKGAVYTGQDMAEDIVEAQAQRRQAEDSIKGYRTGFSTLDVHLEGLVPGRVGILSGGYGQGKTALAINWLAQVGVTAGIPSLFISLEMDRRDVQDRLLAILSKTTLLQIGSGALNTSQYEALQNISHAPLLGSDNYPRDVNEICFMIEKWSERKGIKLVVIDYVGEMLRDQVKFKEDRDERYSRWVKTLRDIAKRLKFHLLILAQVNWEGQLAESKKMAAHADYHLHLDHTDEGQVYLEARKNRFGPKYSYALKYDKQTQNIYETGIMEK